MDAGEFSWAIVMVWLLLAFMGLIGLGVLFSRATNIERPTLVGGLTLAGVLFSIAYFYMAWRNDNISNWGQIWGTLGFPLLMFVLARLIDYGLGPKLRSEERNKATYGAELSD